MVGKHRTSPRCTWLDNQHEDRSVGPREHKIRSNLLWSLIFTCTSCIMWSIANSYWWMSLCCIEIGAGCHVMPTPTTTKTLQSTLYRESISNQHIGIVQCTCADVRKPHLNPFLALSFSSPAKKAHNQHATYMQYNFIGVYLKQAQPVYRLGSSPNFPANLGSGKLTE